MESLTTIEYAISNLLHISTINTSGHKNVRWHKRNKKWQVSIKMNGIPKYFGYYDNIEDAIEKRDQAIIQLNAQGHRFITDFPNV